MSDRSCFSLSSLRIVAVAALGTLSVALAGCGSGINDLAAGSSNIVPALQGRALGGVTPIYGGNVILWETDPANTGYPSASIEKAKLLAGSLTGAVTTTSTGTFSFASNAYTCDPGTYLYITVTGGSLNAIPPGTNGALVNNNLVLMAALGSCSNFPAKLANAASSINLVVDEATTVAAAYALGSFTYVDNTTPGLQGVYIGAPAKNAATTGSCTGTGSSMTCTAAGLGHAFANALNLVDAVHFDGSQPTGYPFTSIPGNASSSVPAAEINTLANIMAACTNSGGGSGTSGAGATSDGSTCGNYFADSKSVTCTTVTCVPVDELTAMIDISKNPSHNLAPLYAIVGTGNGAPFAGYLTAAPQNWAIAITYNGGFGNPPVAGYVSAAAISGGSTGTGYTKGDVLTVTGGGGTGATLTVATITGSGTTGAVASVTVTTGGSGYTTTSGAAVSGGTGSGATFNITATTGTGASPQWLALDANDDVYVLAADLATPTKAGLVALSSNGTQLWTTGMSSAITVPRFLATDTIGNVWVTNEATATASILGYSQSTGALNTTFTTATTPAIAQQPQGLAIDQYNNLWFDQGSSSSASLFEIPYSGGATAGGAYSTPVAQVSGLAFLNQIVPDGNQNIWFSTLGGTSTSTPQTLYVAQNTSAGTSAATPTYPGAAATTPDYSYSSGDTGYSFGLAIDGSGNAWDTASNGGNALTTKITTSTNSGVISGITASGTSFASEKTIYGSEFDGIGQFWYSYYSSTGEIYFVLTPNSGQSNKGIVPVYAPNGATSASSTAVIYDPTALQVDSTGAIWVSGKGSSSVGVGNGSVVQILGPGNPVWPQLSYSHFGAEPQ